MPLFDLNQMQGIVDSHKQRQASMDANKYSADAKRKLNHDVASADRLLNKSAAQAERGARLRASEKELSLRKQTVTAQTALAARDTRARTAISTGFRTAQHKASQAASKARQNVDEQYRKARHDISTAAKGATKQVNDAMKKVSRNHQQAQENLNRKTQKALTESGLITGAQQAAIRHEQAQDRYTAGFAGITMQHEVSMANAKQAALSKAVSWGVKGAAALASVGAGTAATAGTQGTQASAQIKNATQGMSAAQTKEFLKNGGVEQAFSKAQQTVDSIKNPLVRREAQAKLDAQVTKAKTEVMGGGIKQGIAETEMKVEKATKQAEATVAQSPASTQQAKADFMEAVGPHMEGAPGIRPGTGMTKSDANQMFATAQFKGQYKHNLGKSKIGQVQAMLASPAAPTHLSADQIKSGNEWVSKQLKSAKTEEEKQQKVSEKAFTTHLEGTIQAGRLHEVGNVAALEEANPEDVKMAMGLEDFMRKKSVMGQGKRQITTQEASRHVGPENTDWDYKRNRLLGSAIERYNKEVEADPVGTANKFYGSGNISKALPPEVKQARFGRVTTAQEAGRLGRQLEQGFNSGQLAAVMTGMQDKYQGASEDVVNEGLDAFIANREAGESRETRRRDANLIRLQLSPKTRNLVNEEQYLQAKQVTANDPLPTQMKTVVPEDHAVLDFLPKEQKDAVLEAYQIQAWAESATKVKDPDDVDERKEHYSKALNRMGRRAVGLRQAIEEDSGYTVSLFDSKEYPLGNLMLDGGKPYMPKSLLQKVGSGDMKQNVNKLRTTMVPSVFKALYGEDLHAETRQFMEQLDAQGAKYKIGFQPSMGNSAKYELGIMPEGEFADTPHKVRLKDGTFPDIQQFDVFNTGRLIPQINKDIPDPTVYSGDIDRLVQAFFKDRKFNPAITEPLGEVVEAVAEGTEAAAEAVTGAVGSAASWYWGRVQKGAGFKALRALDKLLFVEKEEDE